MTEFFQELSTKYPGTCSGVGGILLVICAVLPTILFLSNADEDRNRKQWAAIFVFMGPVGWVVGPVGFFVYFVAKGMNWVIEELR